MLPGVEMLVVEFDRVFWRIQPSQSGSVFGLGFGEW
jgi:hypothetical protein